MLHTFLNEEAVFKERRSLVLYLERHKYKNSL